MAITVLCDKSDAGAYLAPGYNSEAEVARRGAIYVRDFAKGAVVAMREMNGYDDSDFYATYYDVERGEFKETQYASTRGWTYPCNAVIDATPEIMALWKAELERRNEARRAYAEAIEAKTVRKGKRVRIIAKSGKAAKLSGREGVVFWTQERRSRYGTWSLGTRVGVEVNGERVFCNDTGVVVLTPETERATIDIRTNC